MDGATLNSDVFVVSLGQNCAAVAGGSHLNVSGAAARSADRMASQFIAGSENRLAAALAGWLAAGDARGYSPVVLYGPSGVGKSLLAHGVAACRSDALHVNTTDFARELAEAIEREAVPAWREKFRAAGMLILEDLMHLAERAAAQQQLALILDEFELREAPVVVTSRVRPSEITRLSAGLRSRLVGGLEVAVAPPGSAARQALVERYAAERGVGIEPAAAKLLAEGLTLTAAELRGAILEMEMACKTASAKVAPSIGYLGAIDLMAVKKYLQEHRHRICPSVARITQLVAKFFGLSTKRLCGKSRQRQVSLARSVAIYLARQLTGKSLQSLGKYFGSRDHTTILHSFRSVQERLASDAELRGTLANLQGMLSPG